MKIVSSIFWIWIGLKLLKMVEDSEDRWRYWINLMNISLGLTLPNPLSWNTNIYTENRSVTSDQRRSDTYRTNAAWRLVHPSIPSRMKHENMTDYDPYIHQAEPLHELEMGPTPTLIFQVSRTCLVPLLPWTSSIKEPQIETLSLLSRQCSMQRLLFLSHIQRGGSMFLIFVRWIHVSYARKVDRWFTLFSETDHYSFCSVMSTFISRDTREGSLRNSLIGFLSPSKCLTPWGTDFLLEAAVCSAHSLSCSLLSSLVS